METEIGTKKTKMDFNFLGEILMGLIETVGIFAALFLLSKMYTGDLHFDRTSVIDEGVNKGMIIGEARGVEKEKSLIVQKMLKENTDIKFIASVTGLTTDAILKIQNKM